MAHFLKMSAHRQTCGACNPGPCIRLSCTRNSTWVGQYLERHRQLNRQTRVVAAPRPRRSGVGCGMPFSPHPTPHTPHRMKYQVDRVRVDVDMLFGYPSAMPSASRVKRVCTRV